MRPHRRPPAPWFRLLFGQGDAGHWRNPRFLFRQTLHYAAAPYMYWLIADTRPVFAGFGKRCANPAERRKTSREPRIYNRLRQRTDVRGQEGGVDWRSFGGRVASGRVPSPEFFRERTRMREQIKV